MRNDAPIRLKVSGRADFILPVSVLYLLVFIAALISSRPVLLGCLAVLSFMAVWLFHILDFSKADNNVNLTSVIFPDGRVKLESGRERSNAGFLSARQWCTSQFAVLRINDGESVSRLLILSAQQREKFEFRRLNMWLRQGLCDNVFPCRSARNKPVIRV